MALLRPTTSAAVRRALSTRSNRPQTPLLMRASQQLPLTLSGRREDTDEPRTSGAIRAFHATPQRESAILLAGLGVAGAAMGAKYVVQVRVLLVVGRSARVAS